MEPDSVEDPGWTLTEIAKELRVNPATVRLWVSRGKLKAKRAGQRKLLVQRSELNRMLEASSHRYDNVPTESQSPGYPRIPAPRRPVRVRSWSAYGVAKAKVPPEVMRAAVKDLQRSSGPGRFAPGRSSFDRIMFSVSGTGFQVNPGITRARSSASL